MPSPPQEPRLRADAYIERHHITGRAVQQKVISAYIAGWTSGQRALKRKPKPKPKAKLRKQVWPR